MAKTTAMVTSPWCTASHDHCRAFLPRTAVAHCVNFDHYSNSRFAGSGETSMKSHLGLVMPGTVNRTVTPKRPPNADLRTREYLTEAEVERLLRATRSNRWAHRDATMIL